MAVVKTRKKEMPYVQIHNHFFEDDNLSWKSKGLMGYLLSRPGDWKVLKADLIKRSKDSRDSVDTALLELMENGYVYFYQDRSEDGTFGEWEYLVFETPNDNPYLEESKEKGKQIREERKAKTKAKNQKRLMNSPKSDNPKSDNPKSDNPKSDNPQLLINNSTNKDLNKNNSTNKDLSINESIEKVDLPDQITEVLYRFEKRLTDDNINIGDIKSLFNTYKLLIKHDSEEEYLDFFAFYLDRVLRTTKKTIGSIKSLIDTSIKNDFHEGSITVYKNPNAKQEVLPEWFKEQKEQEQGNQEPSLESEDPGEDPEKIQQEKDEILKSIKARTQKRKQESLI